MLARLSFVLLAVFSFASVGCARGGGGVPDSGHGEGLDGNLRDGGVGDAGSDAGAQPDMGAVPDTGLTPDGGADTGALHDAGSADGGHDGGVDGGHDAAVVMCSPACASGETCSGGVCHCGTGASCTGGNTCVSGVCTPPATCTPGCAAGETCVGGTCMCGSHPSCGGGTMACCSNTCVDTNTSVGNCGACGHPCGASLDCCTGSCINTQTSIDHCGSCAHACDSNTANRCTAGACMCGTHAECLLMCAGPLGCFPA